MVTNESPMIPAYTTHHPLQLRTLRTHARTQELGVSDFLHILPLTTDVASNPAVSFVFVLVI